MLAFFPGALTSVCTAEVSTFEDDLSAFEDVGADVYGVSVDTPFALDEGGEITYAWVGEDPGVEPDYGT